jgi:hypothetical protein
MGTGRTLFRGFLTFMDIAAVATFPLHNLFSLENSVIIDVSEKG